MGCYRTHQHCRAYLLSFGELAFSKIEEKKLDQPKVAIAEVNSKEFR